MTSLKSYSWNEWVGTQLPSELDHSNILKHMDEIIKSLLIEQFVL